MTLEDPYKGLSEDQWLNTTQELLAEHPLTGDDVVEAVHESWRRILLTQVAGVYSMREAQPTPQMMGNFLHLVLPIVLDEMQPGRWRKDQAKQEKDLVYLPEDFFSTELKTSSSKGKIFGNRSMAQPPGPGAKDSMGYYIAVNANKFTDSSDAAITCIQWGWLSRSDWRGQKAATGQQANLSPAVYAGKLIKLYSA